MSIDDKNGQMRDFHLPVFLFYYIAYFPELFRPPRSVAPAFTTYPKQPKAGDNRE